MGRSVARRLVHFLVAVAPGWECFWIDLVGRRVAVPLREVRFGACEVGFHVEVGV